MYNGSDERRNTSGSIDLTAYNAINKIENEEKKRCIKELQKVARKHGFFIYSNIKLCVYDDERGGQVGRD